MDLKQMNNNPIPARSISKLREIINKKFTMEYEKAVINECQDHCVDMIMDSGGVIMYISSSNQKILGYKPAEMTGRNIRDFIHPEDLLLIQSISAGPGKKAGPAVQRMKWRKEHKNGGWVWLEGMVNNCLHDLSSEAITITFTAIADRKKFEDKLRYSEERFCALIEHSNDCTALSSADGTVTYISPSIEKILGYKPEEVIGWHPSEFVHPDDLAEKWQSFMNLLRVPGAVSRIQWRKKHKNGNWIWLEGVSTNLLHNPAVQGIVTNFRDITEQKCFEYKLQDSIEEVKQAKQELVQSEKKLREAQAIAHLGSWELDYHSNIVTWSDETFKIFGFNPGEVQPSLDIYLSIVHPEDLENTRMIIGRSMQAFKDYSLYSRILRKDGSTVYTFSQGRFEFDETGKAIRLYGIVQDVTESKNMEENLKNTNCELETFIYKASHDLRGPISSIIGLTGVSRSEIRNKKAKDYLTTIESLAKKLDGILLGLIHSLTIKDMKSSKDVIDFESLVEESLNLFKSYPGFPRIKIHLDASCNVPVVSNKDLLFSVFRNLIENAIKYQNYNAVESYLKIRITNATEGTSFVFEDNGIGIASSIQHRIFDMYFRGTQASTGSGLGLYLVKLCITKLAGTIELQSTEGKGTVFMIRLPRQNI